MIERVRGVPEENVGINRTGMLGRINRFIESEFRHFYPGRAGFADQLGQQFVTTSPKLQV